MADTDGFFPPMERLRLEMASRILAADMAAWPLDEVPHNLTAAISRCLVATDRLLAESKRIPRERFDPAKQDALIREAMAVEPGEEE